MFARWLARQLGHPSGPGGRLVARVMNRSNLVMNRRAIELLGVRPDDAVLEIGFGGGLALAPLLALTPSGTVAGIDPSSGMVAAARRRHAALVAANRLQLERGTVEHLPWADARFDRVLTVNTIYFWSDPRAALREVRRVLQPGGTFVLGYRPAARLRETAFAQHGFRLLDDEELLGLVAGSGMETLALERGQEGLGHVCLVAAA